MSIKQVAAGVFAGFAGITVAGLTIGKVTADQKAIETSLGIYRCAYDGMRFGTRDDLLDHIIDYHKPPEPNDPRKNPLVLLVKLPPDNYLWDGMCEDGLGLVRFVSLGIKKPPGVITDSAMFRFEQFTRAIDMRDPIWKPTWFAVRALEASPDGINWETRVVYSKVHPGREGEFYGAYPTTGATHIRITSLGIGPLRIWP